MTALVPRLRMFAGPNGSGKSTIKAVISPALLGVYINPDEIEAKIRQRGFLGLCTFGVETTLEEIRAFFTASALIQKAGFQGAVESMRFRDGKLSFHVVSINAYFTSVIADFLRQKLLAKRARIQHQDVVFPAKKMAGVLIASRMNAEHSFSCSLPEFQRMFSRR